MTHRYRILCAVVWAALFGALFIISRPQPGGLAEAHAAGPALVSPSSYEEVRAMRLWSERARDFTKPNDETLHNELSSLQYQVTQQDATERPFDNAYWDHQEPGLYVDIVSGEPLFSSLDKYKSGTGWPSFTRPVVAQSLILHEDRTWFSVRTEVRSALSDSHLGHVFEDGPPPSGLRYCINSAALRFVPLQDLQRQGYAEFLPLFNGAPQAAADSSE